MNDSPSTPSAMCLNLPAVDDALYVIGGKWKFKIIIALSAGTVRFNELQRRVDGISARVLAGELKDLEQNGFVRRTVHDQPPVLVTYELTAYSETLREVAHALSQWGLMHRATLRQ